MLARVFPRRTRATPTDAYAFSPNGSRQPYPHRYLNLPHDITEVNISCAFTWDIPQSEDLQRAWNYVAPATIGGPAMNEKGGDFVSGKYLAPGYVITSRGCPNRCPFCQVWRREGKELRELPIVDGWNVLDDNLLACSESHIRAVFAMLKRQQQKAEFTGGVEAKILKPWHVDLFANVKPKQIFCAYDTPDDYEPLVEAGKMLRDAGFTTASHILRAYVLIGECHDTFAEADARLQQTIAAGFFPMAMLYRDSDGNQSSDWKRFQREYANPTILGTKIPH